MHATSEITHIWQHLSFEYVLSLTELFEIMQTTEQKPLRPRPVDPAPVSETDTYE